jgi:TPR repeat protein
MLLERRGDPASAEAAYRQADAQEDAAGTYNLAALLQRRGDAAGAEAAYRRADAIGAFSLGTLLERRGEIAGAVAAYRRASEQGHGGAAGRLEALLQNGGEQLSEDEPPAPTPEDPAARRATTQVSVPAPPHGHVAEEAPAVGRELDVWPEDVVNAEQAYRDADEQGDGAAAFRLGGLLAERGDLIGAEEAFRRAEERGHPAGASNLGVLLERRGDLDGAEHAYRRADASGDATAAFNLGGLLAARGDLEGAEAAFQRAAERRPDELADKVRAAVDGLRASLPTHDGGSS